jgi:hypothetical protein
LPDTPSQNPALPDPVPGVWLALGLLRQRLNPTIISRVTVTIEVSRDNPYHLAGFGHIPELFRQVHQSDFISNDSLCRLNHEGYPYDFD